MREQVFWRRCGYDLNTDSRINERNKHLFWKREMLQNMGPIQRLFASEHGSLEPRFRSLKQDLQIETSMRSRTIH